MVEHSTLVARVSTGAAKAVDAASARMIVRNCMLPGIVTDVGYMKRQGVWYVVGYDSE